MSKPYLTIKDKSEVLKQHTSALLDEYEFLEEPDSNIPYSKALEGKRINLATELSINTNEHRRK